MPWNLKVHLFFALIGILSCLTCLCTAHNLKKYKKIHIYSGMTFVFSEWLAQLFIFDLFMKTDYRFIALTVIFLSIVTLSWLDVRWKHRKRANAFFTIMMLGYLVGTLLFDTSTSRVPKDSFMFFIVVTAFVCGVGAVHKSKYVAHIYAACWSTIMVTIAVGFRELPKYFELNQIFWGYVITTAAFFMFANYFWAPKYKKGRTKT